MTTNPFLLLIYAKLGNLGSKFNKKYLNSAESVNHTYFYYIQTDGHTDRRA